MATVLYCTGRHRAFVFLGVIGFCAAGGIQNEVLRELALWEQKRSDVDQLREENLLDLCRNGIHRTHPMERICVFQFLRESRFRQHLRLQDVHSLHRCAIDFVQLMHQLSAEQQTCKQSGPVRFEVLTAQGAVLAEWHPVFCAQSHVWNQKFTVAVVV